ncbi:DUF3048 domain-containing protein [Pseudogracilibacillus sp. SE30717A]|uniref:DUF3048 domain-containing protein n=1 Tax=Pseudogracilibacillus sp. SE30717A TaxID=3098293 RepID=UPI00300DF5F7
MKKIYLLIIVIAIGLVAVACSTNEEEKEKGSEDSNEVGKVETEQNIYPFTGIATDEDVTNRAIAVMVNNHAQARPQTGLSDADIVFEMLTEGDITRFLAIYQSTEPEVVGPVRSAREYFFTLADGYDAIYVYHGAANFVNDMIQSRGIENLPGAIYDNDGHLFVRESFRQAPHNSYFQFGAAYDVAAEKEYETHMNYEPLPFLKEDDKIVGEDANYVRINYAQNDVYVEFTYDETTNQYTRYNDGQMSAELNTDVPIQVSNVLIVEAEHRVIDDEQRRSIDIESGGSAYLLQQGKVQQLQWENQDGRIIPIKDGQVVPFVPGKTWINFIPSTTSPQGVDEQVEFKNKE